MLTVSERGFGKRSSSYEYRTTGRGGKGIVAMALTKKTGRIVGSFPVEEADQVMLVTDGGKLIRTPVSGIRIAGRSTQGVIVLNTAEDEKVVSVERLSEEGGDRGRVSIASGPGGNAASKVCRSCGVSVSERATAFSLTCAVEPDSGIAMTSPPRIAQAKATAAAVQPCSEPIFASVGSRSSLAPSPPSGE